MNKVPGRAEARRQRIDAYKIEIGSMGLKAPQMFARYKVSIYTGLGKSLGDQIWNYLRTFLNDDYAAAVREIFSESALELAKNEAKQEIKPEKKAENQLVLEGAKQVSTESIEEKIVAKIKSMPDLSESKKMELIIQEYKKHENEFDEENEKSDVLTDASDSSEEEIVDVETFNPDEDNIILATEEGLNNINVTPLTLARGGAIEYFKSKRDNILSELPDLDQRFQLPSGFWTEAIESEQGLKNFAEKVIKNIVDNCIAKRDLKQLNELEKRANTFFGTFTALSTDDKDDLMEIITIAKAEIMTRNAIDEMVKQSFPNNHQDFKSKSKDWSSKPGYATEAIKWMVDQYYDNMEKLKTLEKKVRLLLSEGVPIKPSNEEKDRLIRIVTDAIQAEGMAKKIFRISKEKKQKS